MSNGTRNCITEKRASTASRTHIEMPAPTFWPMVFAFGVALLFAGMVTHWVVSVVGTCDCAARGIRLVARCDPARAHEEHADRICARGPRRFWWRRARWCGCKLAKADIVCAFRKESILIQRAFGAAWRAAPPWRVWPVSTD